MPEDEILNQGDKDMSILQQIQTELKAPKNQFNPFGKFNYRSLEDIMEAVKPLLANLGASLIVGDEMVAVNERVYVKATATLYDSEMKPIATNTAFAREAETKKGMDDSQITGATSSYARKYCLNGLFGIDDTKDADATNKHGKDEPQPLDTKKEELLFNGFKKEINAHGTSSSIDVWVEKNTKKIKNNLSIEKQKELREYIDDKKKSFDGAKAKQVSMLDDDLPI